MELVPKAVSHVDAQRVLQHREAQDVVERLKLQDVEAGKSPVEGTGVADWPLPCGPRGGRKAIPTGSHAGEAQGHGTRSSLPTSRQGGVRKVPSTGRHDREELKAAQ